MIKATPGKMVEDMIETSEQEDRFIQDTWRLGRVLNSMVRCLSTLMSCAYR